jgi:hypothetical protein
MSTHSQSHPSPPRGLLHAWDELVGPAALPTVPSRRGRKPRVSLNDVLAALTYHVAEGSPHFVLAILKDDDHRTRS